MLTLKLLREQPEFVIARLAVKHFDAKEIVYDIIDLDKKRRSAQQELDSCLAEQKIKASEIGKLMKEGRRDEAEGVKSQVASLKERSRTLEEEMAAAQQEQDRKLVLLPNLPAAQVPEGRTAEDNVIVRQGGVIPDLGENAKPHWELVKELDIIDFDLGVKLTGAGFPLYKGAGAVMQRALMAFFLERNSSAGYIEYQPPYIVNEDSGFGTGQLPDKEGQMYHITVDGFYLIPTAEVPLTNIYRDVILQDSDFPVKMTGYTPCWRREAGSYGKDVRGLNRLHQFDKVEIVRIERPENSYAALDEMVRHVESLVQALALPYRIVRLCGGDMGFTSAITYDFEVWSAAQQRWLEVSSVSNFESYQSNRLKLRYKDEEGKSQLAHTLNGSALALPRILASIIENNQTPDGRIVVPEVLRKYTGFEIIG